jgi:phosphodiesterase/alkaline phosphatase D-like protein
VIAETVQRIGRMTRRHDMHERLTLAVHEHGLDHVVLTDEVEAWLRWIARGLSIIVLAGSVVAFMEFGAPRGHEYLAWEEAASLAALTVACAGLSIAWIWEPVGAGLAMVAGAFVGALAAYQYSTLIALAATLLFLVPAALFLLAWQRTQSWLAIMVVAGVTSGVLLTSSGMAMAFYDDGHGATHPESVVAPLAESDVDWIWSGGVTDTEAVVVAKVPEGGVIRLAYATAETFEGAYFSDAELRGPVYRFNLRNLKPDTRFYYAAEVNGVLDTLRSGTFSTFGSDTTELVVAFGSCARTGSNAAVFDTIRLLEPDLYINTGDLHYGDVMENSLDSFSDLYDLTLTQSGQDALYRSVPIAYIWDDHDFGPNDASSTSPSRQAALISYREHVPHYEFSLEGADAPIAQVFTIGRTRFILTDTRSMRDPRMIVDSPDKTVLGSEQLEWFLGELAASLDTYPVVVWVNSIPWITETEADADHWGGYSFERARIAEVIAHAGSEGLVMLAGDAHMLAIDDGSNSSFVPDGSGSFPVMQAAALDRNGTIKGGPYSEGAFPGGGQFGLMTIVDNGDEVLVELSGLDWTGREIVSLSLQFDGGSGP